MQPKFELDITTIQCEKGSTLFKGNNGRLLVLSPDDEEIIIYNGKEIIGSVDLSYLPFLNDKVIFDQSESLNIIGEDNCFTSTHIFFNYEDLSRPYSIDSAHMVSGEKDIISFEDRKYIIVRDSFIYEFTEDLFFICKTPVGNNPDYKRIVVATEGKELAFLTEVVDFVFNDETRQWEFLDEHVTTVLLEEYMDGDNRYEIYTHLDKPKVISVASETDKVYNYCIKVPDKYDYLVSGKNCYLIEYGS